MKEYLRLIDTQTTGPRCDVTPLFADPAAFAQLIADLSAPFAATPLNYVAGIDALGFVLGGAMALRLGKGFIPIRKRGKLPVAALAADFVDYSGQPKGLEIRRGLLQPGDRVLVVDEWIETGAQMETAVCLIEQVGGVVAGIATVNDHPLRGWLESMHLEGALLPIYSNNLPCRLPNLRFLILTLHIFLNSFFIQVDSANNNIHATIRVGRNTFSVILD